MRPATALMLAGALTGCGEELVPGEQVDLPMLGLAISLGGTTMSPLPRVGALWVDPLGELDDRPSPPEVTVVRPGADWSLNFYRPPPPDVIRRVASPDDPHRTAFAFALAEIVVFQDGTPADGTFEVTPRVVGSTIRDPDRYVGAGGDYVIFYIEKSRNESVNVIPELDLLLIQPPGYYLAAVGCDPNQSSRAVPVMDGRIVELNVVEPTSQFPETRTCVRTHAPP